ncbi:phosphatase PAP2 family protein [Maribellus comscasis]|uniref:Phosphatase PAP2 family protein n=1 Tax=Maribellus comscasis TaxID=2681766 RepID=A0A6I6JS33_9BACT|nr:phosphatase PAP2 family protein [Maribellus comscasis]QGY44039.1 phosphatase PAP2 family protein [Maribellus comscasis]
MSTKKASLFIFLLLFLTGSMVSGQRDSTKTRYNPYKMNYYLDVPISVGGLLASKYGTDYLRDREPKNIERIVSFTPDDVWWFDRSSARIDPEKGEKALNISDYFLRAGMWSPLLMYIDPKVRDIWYDFALLHVETQAINATVYLAASIPIPRLRPFMYNPDVSMEKKLGENTTNSFFSGHASVVAASTFFMVKVYYDLHPEAKHKKLFYALACVPPAFTGYLRYKGAKHFPSDIITGFAVGAATGILVPEFHKKKYPLKIYPVSIYDSGIGVRLLYTLK